MKNKKTLLFNLLLVIFLAASTNIFAAETSKSKPKQLAKKSLTCEQKAEKKKFKSKTKQNKYLKNCRKKQAKKSNRHKKTAKKATS